MNDLADIVQEEGPGTMLVAQAWDRETLEPIILVRAGDHLLELTVDGAVDLATELMAAVNAHARHAHKADA